MAQLKRERGRRNSRLLFYLDEWLALLDNIRGELSRTATALSAMGMVVIASTLAVGPIADTLNADGMPIGPLGATLHQSFPWFADDLAWWTEAAKAQRARKPPPY